MIVLVNADPPDQVKYTLPPDDAIVASHFAGLSKRRSRKCWSAANPSLLNE